MKGLIIPNRELRVLSGQLQNFKQGYTVEEVRVLDKVIKIMGVVLEPFTKELTDIFESDIKEVEKRNQMVEDLVKTKGKEMVKCDLDDADFEFIKNLWKRMSGLSGADDVREIVIGIDDAIKNTSNNVFKGTVN